MSWRDFFYYSKGERRGLIVLLCLITIAGILLILSNNRENARDPESQQNNVNAHVQPDNSNNNQNLKDQFESGMSSSPDRNSGSNKNTSSTSSAGSNSNKNLKNNSYPNKPAASSSGNADNKPAEKKESVSERVERLTSYSRPSYPRTEKFTEGTVVELNTADTTMLKKVPGIGSTFAKRIVSYRDLLGGFYSVTQLSEIYGIDEDRYASLAQWFSADPELISKILLNTISQDSLNRHPYVNYSQSRVIMQLRRQKGKLTGWENLQLLYEFTEADKIRLQYYLSFE